MGTRALRLKGEHLAELTSNELASVAGGTVVLSADVCIQIHWPTQDCTGYYPSINAPCTR